jgi:glyoxylase-like metal-dependent hydrolase (beta-lactamase superfamily II)
MAEVHILCEGYAHETEAEARVGSTIAFVDDGDTRVVIDPGMVADRGSILGSLTALGLSAEAITDIVLSHHHPDHTLNAALFPNARVHDVWAIYHRDEWIDRPAEGFELSASVSLIETPGHTDQDITTLVETSEGVVAFTHLWWAADGPADDPYSPDRGTLSKSRERVLGVASIIVPGHGALFVPTADTPR